MNSRFESAIRAIDHQNSEDPQRLFYEGESHPKEILHSELMTKWVKELDSSAAEAQLLAARASHLRRWDLPRQSYPSGRAGYLRWRREQAKRHSQLTGKILRDVGYDGQTVDRVLEIIQKKDLKSDSQVQTHEDALCLVFLQTQYESLKDRFIKEEGREQGLKKLAGVIQKTLAKMSKKAGARAEKILGELEQTARE